MGRNKHKLKNKYLFSENMTKELYVKIMEKHWKEMEWIAGKKFELICDNHPKHTGNLAKDFYKNNCIRIDWPAYSLDLNPIENIWSIMKTKLNQENTKKISEVINPKTPSDAKPIEPPQ